MMTYSKSIFVLFLFYFILFLKHSHLTLHIFYHHTSASKFTALDLLTVMLQTMSLSLVIVLPCLLLTTQLGAISANLTLHHSNFQTGTIMFTRPSLMRLLALTFILLHFYHPMRLLRWVLQVQAQALLLLLLLPQLLNLHLLLLRHQQQTQQQTPLNLHPLNHLSLMKKLLIESRESCLVKPLEMLLDSPLSFSVLKLLLNFMERMDPKATLTLFKTLIEIDGYKETGLVCLFYLFNLFIFFI